MGITPTQQDEGEILTNILIITCSVLSALLLFYYLRIKKTKSNEVLSNNRRGMYDKYKQIHKTNISNYFDIFNMFRWWNELNHQNKGNGLTLPTTTTTGSSSSSSSMNDVKLKYIMRSNDKKLHVLRKLGKGYNSNSNSNSNNNQKQVSWFSYRYYDDNDDDESKEVDVVDDA